MFRRRWSDFSFALSCSNVTTSLQAHFKSNSAGKSFSFPASIFEKSRTSLRITRSAAPDRSIVSTYSTCSSLRSVAASNCAIPKTPFIGVRISWLILARNCDFTEAVFSASTSLTCVTCASAASRNKSAARRDPKPSSIVNATSPKTLSISAPTNIAVELI